MDEGGVVPDKFYVEDPAKIYGCVYCGTIQGDIIEDPMTGHTQCDSCGEKGIVSFQAALDTLNDLHLRGMIKILPQEDDDPEFEYHE